MHRLQPVAHVGQRARHDHAHGVIEVGAPHLLFDGDRRDVVRGLRRRRTSSGGGGAGGRVVSSLTETWFSLVFMALPEGPAERICTLANRGRKTNKKRSDERTLTY